MILGQFGKVYKATLVRSKSEKMIVAVKTIKKYQSEKETSEFLHEMGAMTNLMHPNIIHLYGIVQQGILFRDVYYLIDSITILTFKPSLYFLCVCACVCVCVCVTCVCMCLCVCM